MKSNLSFGNLIKKGKGACTCTRYAFIFNMNNSSTLLIPFFLSLRYILRTIVDPPHQSSVTSLRFRPDPSRNRNQFVSRNGNESSLPKRYTQLMLATTGLDGKFKVRDRHERKK